MSASKFDQVHHKILRHKLHGSCWAYFDGDVGTIYKDAVTVVYKEDSGGAIPKDYTTAIAVNDKGEDCGGAFGNVAKSPAVEISNLIDL